MPIASGTSPDRPRRGVALAALAATTLLLAGGCGTDRAVLDPEGPRAERIAALWWVMLTLGTLVFITVMALLAFALWRAWRRRGDGDRPTSRIDRRTDDWLVIGGGVIVPSIILIVLLVVTLRAMSALAEPDDDVDAGEPPLIVEVVGNQWWWEVRYPETNVVTANEIHIPVDRPVEVRVRTDDVIHSFWVPQLQGKMDMIPGHTNTLWIEATEPGVFRGQCAEFCGLQHALMDFHVIADEPVAFADWLALQQELAVQPTESGALVGQGLFSTQGCAGCHTVRGTNAAGVIGPDLTHLMSRRHIVAGLLPNNRGTLGGWVVDAQHIKPGNEMPSFALTPEELQAVLDYLTALE